ncbi:hypothetical protein EHF33_16125 [Deinococcus psychrotolerans]|uniref:Uncharacterized protein n=1 Tax=Deinococcus psychrotolerans TaxID=2489213 RepID=A0A3G8YGI2_9DEIO|nr:hypothetical protein [Deinococcus psychrotolerans]AZI44402.1 hypothetical protein EHF33_16125 [Deinococcus psychrotolerans]
MRGRSLTPPETWMLRTGPTEDLHLVAHIQAEAFLSLDVGSDAAQQLAALCEPSAKLFVLEEAHRLPIAFAALRTAGRGINAAVSVVALIPLTPSAFVQVASRLLRAVEEVQQHAGGGRLELFFPDLLPENNRINSADLPEAEPGTEPREVDLDEALEETFLASDPLPYWPGASTAARPALP